MFALRTVQCASRLWRGAGGLRRHAHDGFAALNIYKDAAKAPVEKADDEYPEWLWTVLDTGRTHEELYREADGLYQRGGYDAVFEGMSEKDLRRLFKLTNTDRIKESNDMRRGGRVM